MLRRPKVKKPKSQVCVVCVCVCAFPPAAAAANGHLSPPLPCVLCVPPPSLCSRGRAGSPGTAWHCRSVYVRGVQWPGPAATLRILRWFSPSCRPRVPLSAVLRRCAVRCSCVDVGGVQAAIHQEERYKQMQLEQSQAFLQPHLKSVRLLRL